MKTKIPGILKSYKIGDPLLPLEIWGIVLEFYLNKNSLQNLLKKFLLINKNFIVITFNTTKTIKVCLHNKSPLSRLFLLYGNLFTNLQVLDISGPGFDNLKYISSLTMLNSLSLRCTFALEDVSPISTFTNLKRLCINNCPFTDKNLKFISTFTNLNALEITNNHDIEEKGIYYNISYISTLINITSLSVTIGNNAELKNIETLTKITKLAIINSKIDNISFITNLSKLQELNVSGCSKLQNMTLHLNHKTLHTLNVSNCNFESITIASIFLCNPNIEKIITTEWKPLDANKKLATMTTVEKEEKNRLIITDIATTIETLGSSRDDSSNDEDDITVFRKQY